MIKEAYCSFEVAKLLKEKGFDEATHQFYKVVPYLGTEAHNVCIKSLNGIEDEPFHNSVYGFDVNGKDTGEYACPTHQMVIAWLREEKGIAIVPILSSVLDNEKFLWDVEITVAKTNESYRQGWIYSYERACEIAIKYCIENLI